MKHLGQILMTIYSTVIVVKQKIAPWSQAGYVNSQYLHIFRTHKSCDYTINCKFLLFKNFRVYIINRQKLYEVHKHKRKVASIGRALILLVNVRKIHQLLKCSYKRPYHQYVLPGNNITCVKLENKAVNYSNPVCCSSTS